jgi:hypothetical protein
MFMRYFLSIVLLVMCSISVAQNNPNQCSKFNSIALQLALAQTNMQSPLNLGQLQNALGPGNVESTSVITTYTWLYKSRILLVRVINGDIVKKLLTGDDDGSPTSKKMEQIRERLKTATSIWIINDIQQQLGSGRITRNQFKNYIWRCGMGSLEVTADHDSRLTAATIGYRSYQNEQIIENQVGSSHPPWDIKTESLGQSYRAWKRAF